MKKILFVALALLVSFASCVKDEQYPGITITEVSYSPTAVTATMDVTVSAKITCFNTFTATLYYMDANLVGGKMIEVEMIPTNEKDIYKGVIPAMPNDTKITFYVGAKNSNAFAQSEPKDYTVGAVEIDYSALRLNELNGNDKFIEIYNSGNEPIDLTGVYMEKDNEMNWVGVGVILGAGEYLLLYSEDVAAQHPDNYIFASGLSAKKNVRVQLFSPAGVSLDDFNLVNIELNDPSFIPAPASYSRNADLVWYYADATPGAPNVDGTTPLLGLEGDVPPTPVPDYNNIVINELNGDTKFIEIYNKGELDLPLEGMYLCKDGVEGIENAKWVADATVVAPAHGYVLLYSTDVQIDHPDYPANLFFDSGLSAKKTIRMALFMADGTQRDAFERGTTGEWGLTISNVAPKSYARTPDGGDWKLADATPGEANPAEGEDIPQE